MEKVKGIKSVDFKIKAKGHGVVNWNGPTQLKGDGGNYVDNHTLPKLRGYSSYSDKYNEKGTRLKKEAIDIDFRETPLYISQNCIRHHLFKEHAYDMHLANKKNIQKMLVSITGLIRGYVVPESQNKRTSPLLLEDFVDQLGNGNFEQFSAVKFDEKGKRESSSIFSKTTFGDTEYISYGSLSIEQLQFISLDRKFDRQAIEVEGKGEVIAQKVQEFIQSLNTHLKPEVTFNDNYVRKGTIFEEGEAGLLLNQDAMQALVEHTLQRLTELSIRQAKSYMYVDEILVDYNDSNQMMRIKRNESSISEEPESEYAVYFEAK